ncbi:MAG: hypothetical protein AABZ08_08990 [Planctomycetota bacterium]
MSALDSTGSNTPQPPATPVYVATDAAKAKARTFFEHARKAAELKNYDYAIKLYVDGLALWPDAVDDGLKSLRVAGVARRQDGGKSAGFLAGRQHPTNTKDLLKNLNNALYMFGMEPTAIPHMEQILYNASKARLIRTVAWIAAILPENFANTKKLPEAHYVASCEAMDVAADFAMALAEDEIAMNILKAIIVTADVWNGHLPESTSAPRARSAASGKLTIIKGKFDKADGFQASLKDAESQRELIDQQKPLITPERAAALLAKVRKEWADNRDSTAKLFNLVEMLIKMDREEGENEAIALLEAEYAAQDIYELHAKADEIRMKLMSRRRRELEAQVKAQPADSQLRQALVDFRTEQTNKEIDIFLDRQKAYPSDMRTKFLLAVRYLNAKRYDDAIPLFQISQSDLRSRLEARLYMGRCFHEKQFYPQAIQTLQTTLNETDVGGGPVILELNYWLGRALQAAQKYDDAIRVYGHLIQLDYNYRDARPRLESLVATDKT